jgi:outer membrane protein assembly factor BamB
VLVQDGATLLAVPRGGGAPAWTFKVGQPSPVVQPAVVGQTVVAPVLGQGLAGLDLQSGQVLWSKRLPGALGQSSPLALPGGKVAYAVGGLRVLDAANGRVEWHQPGIETFGRIAFDRGTIFAEAVTAQTAALVAIDATTGKLEWAQPFNPQAGLGPVAGDGVVVASDGSNVLAAFDQSDGSKIWSVPLRTAPNGDPVVVGDHVVVQEQGRSENANQRDYRLSAFDARSGHMGAQWELAGSGFTHAGFGAEGDTLTAPGIASGIAVYLLKMVSP